MLHSTLRATVSFSVLVGGMPVRHVLRIVESRCFGMLTCVGLVLALHPSRARAADSDQCIDSFEQAQELRKRGKFVAATEQLIRCSQLSCPAFIVKDCTSWFGEVQAAQPSVVLSARQGAQTLNDVQVFADNVLLSERLDGRSLPIDPGQHEFRFQAAGKEPVLVSVLIIEGEKHKPVIAEFPAPAPAIVESVPKPGESPAAPPDARVSSDKSSVATSSDASLPERGRSVPVASYILGGAGLLAVGGGVVLRVIGANQFDDLKNSCGTTCATGDVDDVKTKYTLSKVAFGVGAAALITAGALYFVNPSKSSPASSAWFIAPVIAPSGVGTVASARF
ncbi:MAG TPA: hypothetical protein VFQ61_11195 [Polyangiaceae bacterium]|nr:hypothetical protein [Polyangiaceae bacterium]